MKALYRAAIRTVLVAAMAVVGFVALGPATVPSARAEAMDTCVHAPTLGSLHDCVQMMAANGIIDNAGIAQSLLAEIDMAQAAVSRRQPDVAILALGALQRAVAAQAGIHIAQPDADHLIMHAQLVVQALEAGSNNVVSG